MKSLEFEAGKKYASVCLGRVLVLGLGKSGRAVVDYLLETPHRIESLTVAVNARTPEAERFAENVCRRSNVAVLFDCDGVEGSFDVGIVSPGIPEGSSLYQSALRACAEVIGEVEFAWRESATESRWIAVTGTNGKTTVTALCAHILREAGMNARAVGNIGDTCLDAVREGNTEIYVAETSSYQLASTKNFAPHVAVLLNITPDHLHWHGTFEAYRDAKLKLLANLSHIDGAVAVLDATNDVVRAEVRRLRACLDSEQGFSYIPLGTKEGVCGDMRALCGSENAAFLGADNKLHVALNGFNQVLLSAGDLQIKGDHNVVNALAAASATLALGADVQSVICGLATFEPLEHRIEPCGTVNGIACYNDSKATNIDATLKALDAFSETCPVILLGGDDKGTDLAPLVSAVHAHARAAVCFGAACERFARAIEADMPAFPVLRAQNLKEAFEMALSVAHKGDIVLLSPACASFDEFRSFEERGCAFKKMVVAQMHSLEV